MRSQQPAASAQAQCSCITGYAAPSELGSSRRWGHHPAAHDFLTTLCHTTIVSALPLCRLPQPHHTPSWQYVRLARPTLGDQVAQVRRIRPREHPDGRQSRTMDRDAWQVVDVGMPQAAAHHNGPGRLSRHGKVHRLEQLHQPPPSLTAIPLPHPLVLPSPGFPKDWGN
jgi:hypothetical protein